MTSVNLSPNITDLEALVGALPATERERFERIYHVSTAAGYLRALAAMQPRIERTFGSLKAVETQQMVKVTNRIVLEGALFNPLRARRPADG